MTSILLFGFIMLNLLIPSLFLAIKNKRQITEVLPFTFILIVLILYLGGLFSFLLQSAWLIVILNIILSINVILYIVKTKKEIFKLITPSFVIWCILLCFIAILHKGRMMIEWDEFSHWGDVVKSMFYINDFSTSKESLSIFQSYLPGMSLFQYFFQVLNLEFSEPLVFVSSQLFTISIYTYILRDLKWKNFLTIIASLLVVIILPTLFFNNFYTSAYIDAFLGTIFAFSLLLAIKKEKNDFDFWYYALSLFMLTFTKDIGILLSAISIFVYIFNYFFFDSNDLNFKHKMITIIKKGLILSSVVVGSYLTWKYNIYINNARTIFSDPIILSDLIDIFTGNDISYKTQVVDNYIYMIKNSSLVTGIVYLSIPLTIVIFVIYMIVITLLSKREKLKLTSYYTIIIFSLLGYIFLLLVLYLFKFTEYEALNLASHQRYLGTYFQCIAIIIFSGIINLKHKYKNFVLYSFLLFVIVYAPIKSIFIYNFNSDQTVSIRSEYTNAANIISQKLGDEKEDIYIVVQNTTGYEFLVLKFSARLNLSSVNTDTSWSIGEKYSETDMWTKDISAEEWKKDLIENYTYVFLYKIDDKFIEQFSPVFEMSEDISNNSLYKVNKDSGLLEIVSD